MPKKVQEQITEKKQIQIPKEKKIQKTKANRFDNFLEVDPTSKNSWHSESCIYLGHLPHGFYENELKEYFGQYGEVLGVKVARSKTTNRSKGYAFVQFKYPEVANIVADTMNGYLLLGKVLISNVLKTSQKNPFSFGTSKKYRFINWKKMYRQQKNKPKSEEQIHKHVKNLLTKEQQKNEKFKTLGIQYKFKGFKEHFE